MAEPNQQPEAMMKLQTKKSNVKYEQFGIELFVWNVLKDGVVIGTVRATYSAPTQRKWGGSITVDGKTYESKNRISLKDVITDFEEQVTIDSVGETIEVTTENTVHN